MSCRCAAALAALLLAWLLAFPDPVRAVYEGDGYFRASVTDADGIGRTRSADNPFQDDDTLISVDIGFRSANPVSNQTGFVRCADEGTDVLPRPLGNWAVQLGQGTIEGCIGSGTFTVGVSSTASPTNPTNGELEIFGSTVSGNITVRRGTLLAQSATIGSVTVLDEGQATVVSTVASGLIGQGGGGLISAIDSHVTGGVIGGRGTFDLLNTGMTSAGNTSFDTGTLSAQCEIGIECRWQVGQEFRLGVGAQGGTPALAADAQMVGQSVRAGTTLIRSGSTLFVASGDWESAGLFSITGAGSSAHFGLDSRLDAGGELFVGSGTPEDPASLAVMGPDTVVDVAGDLRIGNQLADPFPGAVVVGGGALVIVRGTLLLRADSTLDLQPGGSVRAEAADLQGAVLENGGVLLVPEPAPGLGAAAAIAALAARARRQRGGAAAGSAPLTQRAPSRNR